MKFIQVEKMSCQILKLKINMHLMAGLVTLMVDLHMVCDESI